MVQPATTVAPRQDDPPYRPGEPVALFIPCYIDQFYPKIAQATARLLKRYGVPVVYPSAQTCCGQPAFNSGYWDEARRVIHHFCDVFEHHRWIVCPSGSCTAMCRVFFGHADPDPRIVGIGRRVIELTEFLHDMLGVTDTEATFPKKVTMHIGCHCRRELGVVDQPMGLLKSVRGIEYCELPNIEEC
ncbi:MAG: (Fe-S)-binding protein, partial [Planctomycetaceae bacterium]|nr:(Fe-S)-binding protein [Planctomycetaceae bacterium]